MVMKFDQLVNGAINVGFGAAAVAVEGGKKVLDDLNTKGEQVRKDAGTPDIARSVSDMFEQAGGTISDLTERLGMQGETAAQRVLGELCRRKVAIYRFCIDNAQLFKSVSFHLRDLLFEIHRAKFIGALVFTR